MEFGDNGDIINCIVQKLLLTPKQPIIFTEE